MGRDHPNFVWYVLQQSKSNSTRDAPPPELAVDVKPSHPPCGRRCLRWLVGHRSDAGQPAADMAHEHRVEHGRMTSELIGQARYMRMAIRSGICRQLGKADGQPVRYAFGHNSHDSRAGLAAPKNSFRSYSQAHS
jgi:hypothetical protein